MIDIFKFVFPPSYPNFQIQIPLNLKIKNPWPYHIKNNPIREFCYSTSTLQKIQGYVIDAWMTKISISLRKVEA